MFEFVVTVIRNYGTRLLKAAARIVTNTPANPIEQAVQQMMLDVGLRILGGARAWSTAG